MPARRDLKERFDEKWFVEPTSGCHLWTAAVSSTGYGVIGSGVGKGLLLAHRVSYERSNGKISDGAYIDHKCSTRSCINPEHLREVTPAENALENNDSPPAVNAGKTECVHGHPFDAANTYIRPDNGHRQCRTCRAAA